jgi:hypothetical protein
MNFAKIIKRFRVEKAKSFPRSDSPPGGRVRGAAGHGRSVIFHPDVLVVRTASAPSKLRRYGRLRC